MKRVLLVAAVVAAALSVGGARAYFTAQAEVKDNVITAGTLGVSVEPSAAALCIEPIAPGVTVTRSVGVSNTGSLALDAVTTIAKKAGYTDLWNMLECRVTCEGAVLYEGVLSSMRTQAVRIAPGRTATVEYAIGLPAEAGNELQGDYVRATLYVDAEQSR